MITALIALATLTGAQKSPAPAPHKNAKGQLFCPVMKTTVASTKAAAGFSDYKGSRYYFCCGGCKPAFDKDPSKYAALAVTTKKITPPADAEPKSDEPKSVRVGKYVVELWPPEDGVFAGEEIDIEVGVFDAAKKAADGGLMGVSNITVKAAVTMPAMAGMPVQRPKVHQEGRAGVQGLELFFPHGGEYRIALTLTPKGGKPIAAAFLVDVQDERPATGAKPPYALEVVDFPAGVQHGIPVDLKIRIVDAKTGAPVTRFDVAHEQRFHLLLASRDLTRFMHEHPVMAADGTWTYRATFPAGGDWLVYGDVAPEGKGSRILAGKISVAGPAPTGAAMHAPNAGPFTFGGVTGEIEPVAGEIPVGKMTALRVRLTDAVTGAPVADTQPYLGAAGHLMIIHEDGATVVHSHPQDDPATQTLVKRGEILFNARFPKAGRYVAYAQVQRGGEIKTLGFTLEVK